jgi:hypothetical protein
MRQVVVTGRVFHPRNVVVVAITAPLDSTSQSGNRFSISSFARPRYHVQHQLVPLAAMQKARHLMVDP